MINLLIVRDIARQKKISMREIARRVGVTEQGLQKIIRENSTKVDTLEAIAQALDVPVSIFFSDSSAGANIVSSPNAVSGHGNTVLGSGNHTSINVALPDSGFQKIIKSDGSQTTVEVATSNSESGIPKGLQYALIMSDLHSNGSRFGNHCCFD